MSGKSFSDTSQVGKIPQLSNAQAEKQRARSSLMLWVLLGYFFALALGIAVPFSAAFWLSTEQLAPFREVMQQTAGLSQGLFGILGVIVGFYFKEEVISNKK